MEPWIDGNRAELVRGELTEWYINDPRGLEQGFTLFHAPPESSAPLVLEFVLAGGLRAYPSADRRSMEFRASGGAAVLRYAGLTVTDRLDESCWIARPVI